MEYQPVRTPRYSFNVDVEVTDMQSNAQMWGRTSDLSLFGLRVDTVKLLSQGTRVKLRIADNDSDFVAFGRVAYVQPDLGMGVVFSSVEPEAQRILERWVAELAGQRDPHS